ncbi:2-oxoglutarate-dependent dioxygenase 19 [Ziziphus jujuba]|uniref:2-oxoglutarate-dependent dioxygenase 19 n=1 Tax=Ziziphus jujuba TaxID=326968 RepID=A0A6P4A133_ZIZJJ|nr:2-oxoglutarate-dependent dioxygenase 19 [Ziziphus jujuba]
MQTSPVLSRFSLSVQLPNFPMAGTASLLTQNFPSQPANTKSFVPTDSSPEAITAFDDEIPTIDYQLLFADDHDLRSKALAELGKICEEYGFFNLVNHGIPESVMERALKGVSDFFYLTDEEKKEYERKDSTDRIRWGLGFSPGDYQMVKREYLKVIPHPKFQRPTKPPGFGDALEDYYKRDREVILNLARAVSKTLGYEESYIEKVFNLEQGSDVSAMNVYPPWFQSTTPIGLPAHFDPGYLVSLIQNVNGGLQILHKGRWVNVHMPPNAIFINNGDHLEILTNGKYKSPMHRVILNNKVRRVSVPTVHGPSLDTFVTPAAEFVDEFHPPAYKAMIYKDTLEANDYHEVDGKSCMAQLRL